MSELTPAMREALEVALIKAYPQLTENIKRFGFQEEETISFLAGVAYATKRDAAICREHLRDGEAEACARAIEEADRG